MKRFYSILSFFLLSLVGITQAVAQDYKAGERLETPEDLLGKQFFLYAPGSSDDHPAGWLNDERNFTKDVTNNCYYELEAVGEESEDGYPLYYLKNAVNGKYVVAREFGEEELEGFIPFSDDKTQAMKIVVLNYEDVTGQDPEPQTRTSATSKKQTLDNPGFIFSEAKTDKNGKFIYIGGLSMPFYSPYQDTNVWEAYEKQDAEGAEKLEKYINAYFPDGVDAYRPGTEPGTYKEEIVAEVQNAYDAIDSALGNDNLSQEEVNKLCADLKAAYDKLMANGYNALVEGYYFIYNNNDRYLSTSVKSNVEFLWAIGDYSLPSELTAADAKQIWKVVPGKKENQYYVQNLYTGNYINGQSNPAVKVDGDPAYTLGEKGLIGVSDDGTDKNNGKLAGFIFYEISAADSVSKAGQFHAKYNNNGVMTWNDFANANNNFHFTPVSEEDIQNILKEVEQAALNDQLQNAFNKAFPVYSAAHAVKGAPIDATFSGEGALVESADQYFSAVQHNGEGTIASLLDGTFGTVPGTDTDSYFHTSWAQAFTPSLSRYHYVAVDLQKELDGGIQIKMAKRRTFNDYPMQIAFFGTNEIEDMENPDDADWKLLGVGNVDWSIGMPLTEPKDTVIPGAIGVAGTTFEGSYRYFKFGAIQTRYSENDRSSDRGYFCLSELNVYKASDDAAAGLIQMVDEQVRKDMVAAMDAAQKELTAGKATEATIKALEAAYEKFAVQVPVPSRVWDTAEAAKKFADNADNNGFVGDELAHYTTETLEALREAIKAAKAYDADGKTAAEINAEVKKVDDALAAFKASVILPEAGKAYFIRSASHKMGADTHQLTSFLAYLYAKNSGEKNAFGFFNMDGSENEQFVVGNDYVLDTDQTGMDWDEIAASLSDTIQASKKANFVWCVEKAEAGKMVIRNVGTGLYMTLQGGEALQGKAASDISVVLSKPGYFVLDAGKDNGDKEKQLNAMYGGSVGTWADVNDWNAQWFFEEVESYEATPMTITSKVEYQIVTLPVAVGFAFGGTKYTLVGQTADNKLALAEADKVPAGTPFILKIGESDELENTKFVTYEYDEPVSDPKEVKYVLDPVKVEGLQGTLSEPATLSKGYAYFSYGQLVPTGKRTVIGVNSGYFDGTHKTGVEPGVENIDMDDIVINSISDANVVVLPTNVNVYRIDGTLVRKNVKSADAAKGLPAGLYIIGNQKILVK